jgi:hypothetical protein
MKVIISHDIDHYNWSDHIFKDLFIQKYLLKNFYFFIRGQIPYALYKARMSSFLSNRLHRLEELTLFNSANGIPASYFMGVRNGLGLSYDCAYAQKIAVFLKEKNAPLYVHGIAFDDLKEMEEEKNDFVEITGSAAFLGMRMHYLRNSENTLKFLAGLGYRFDSTTYALRDPYFIDNMIEFPVCAMESYEISYHDTDLEKIKKSTLAKIETASSKSLNYFTVIFHDAHFSDSFPLQRDWYIWLIHYFRSNAFEFVDFKMAVDEMTRKGIH